MAGNRIKRQLFLVNFQVYALLVIYIHVEGSNYSCKIDTSFSFTIVNCIDKFADSQGAIHLNLGMTMQEVQYL